MYLSLRASLTILVIGLSAVGFVVIASFTTSAHTVAVKATPGGVITLIPLSPTLPIRALEETISTIIETPSEIQETEVKTEPIIVPAPAPNPKKAGTFLKTATASVQPAPILTPNCTGSFPEEFLCLLNQYRSSKNKGKLSGSSALSKVALTHSVWMSTTGIFSHTGENGSRLGDRCKAAGISCRAENLANNINSPQELLNMWKASPSHNTNLLGGYSTAGLAISGSYITLLLN